jgi:hypothetical protein
LILGFQSAPAHRQSTFGVAGTLADTMSPLQQTLTDTASALTLTDGSHRIEAEAAAANFGTVGTLREEIQSRQLRVKQHI